MYNFDEISPGCTHLSNHQNVLPSTLQKRNAFSFQDTCVQMYVHVQNDARMYVRARMLCVYTCVTKDRERVACTARIDAHVGACALDAFPPL